MNDIERFEGHAVEDGVDRQKLARDRRTKLLAQLILDRWNDWSGEAELAAMVAQDPRAYEDEMRDRIEAEARRVLFGEVT